MARIRDILKKARNDGGFNGANSAMWYWDSTYPKVEDFKKVLKGIREGDPEIMDTFMDADLSGQHADGVTPKQLFEEFEMSDKQIERYGDEVLTEWENGFNSGYQIGIEQSCLEGLRRDVVFHVTVTIDEQDESKLLSDLENLLAKQNCELVYGEHEEA